MRNQETGFRDLFMEIPVGHLRPVTADERTRRAFVDALSQLATTKDADDVQQFKDGLKRVFSSLSTERLSDEKIADLHTIIHNLEWLMERRIEQVMALRYYITEFCPRGLAARILHESAATVNGRHGKPAMTDAPRCDGDEHTYQLGELRCDCGRVAVRGRPAARRTSRSASRRFSAGLASTCGCAARSTRRRRSRRSPRSICLLR